MVAIGGLDVLTLSAADFGAPQPKDTDDKVVRNV